MKKGQPRGSRKSRMLAADARCVYCRKRLHRGSATIDHIIPRSRGGPTKFSNLALACVGCNRKKADSIWVPRFKPVYLKWKDE